MYIGTQSNSNTRVKFDKLGGDTILSELYAKFEASSVSNSDFVTFCVSVIDNGVSSKQKKFVLTNKIKMSKSRAAALKVAQDYVLAGQGLGV